MTDQQPAQSPQAIPAPASKEPDYQKLREMQMAAYNAQPIGRVTKPTPVPAAPEPTECETLLKSAAPCVMKPGDPAKPWTQADVENAFRDQSARAHSGDFDGMKAMLVAQAQTLHMLFAQAIEKYADGGWDNSRLYGNMALKAQNYCRMTVAALAGMKGKNADAAPSKNAGTN